ncbi:MAG: hypothetical protein RR086_01765 [Clostridia bacterium]
MIEKLRKNYQLVNVLSYLCCILFFCLSQWYYLFGQINYIALAFNFVCTKWMAILIIVLEGAIITLLLSPISSVILNLSRIYFVPRAEFGVLVRLSVTSMFMALSLFNLTFLFSPVVLIWGLLLYKLVLGVGAGIGFYLVTSKLYCNTATKPYYFKVLSIVIIVYFAFNLLTMITVA